MQISESLLNVPPNQSVRNTILAQMSSDEFQRLQPHLEPIVLEMATELAFTR
jgi:hypothetical protein